MVDEMALQQGLVQFLRVSPVDLLSIIAPYPPTPSPEEL
jgi:hypothetical protein